MAEKQRNLKDYDTRNLKDYGPRNLKDYGTRNLKDYGTIWKIMVLVWAAIAAGSV